MYRSEIMNEDILEPSDYPSAERKIEESGWTLSTYVVEGASRLNSKKMCDLYVEVTAPSGEVWAENRGPIVSADGLIEAEGALKTAKWVKDHWSEVPHS